MGTTEVDALIVRADAADAETLDLVKEVTGQVPLRPLQVRTIPNG
jgi:hypothetical protein